MSETLQQSVRELIRPLVKLLIDGGITYPILIKLFREAYVEIAQSKYGLDDKQPTHSRISVLTGIHRQEVKRLVGRSSTAQATPAHLSLSAKVVAVWCSEPRYLDPEMRPITLPRTAPADEPSVADLVASVSKDVRAWSLIEEWLRLGIVELDGDRVRLREVGIVPNKAYDEKAFYFGRNLAGHIAASAHNLAGDEPAMFDRAVYYNKLSASSLEKLRNLSKELGEELLLNVNRYARELAEADKASGQFDGVFVFGAYLSCKGDESEDPSSATDHKRQDP